MLRSVTWRFTMCDDQIALSEELEADWVHTVDFIAQNVQPLSKLTIILDMCHRRDMASGGRRVARDNVMLPLCQLKGLRDLCVHLSEGRNFRFHAAEKLRLERLAMGEGYHPTEEEPEAREAEMILF
jgi:hypothetical protein